MKKNEEELNKGKKSREGQKSIWKDDVHKRKSKREIIKRSNTCLKPTGPEKELREEQIHQESYNKGKEKLNSADNTVIWKRLF